MPITRRQFLHTITSGTATLLASCTSKDVSWLPSTAPAVLGTRELVIWTTTYGIDTALARWRGAHAQQSVTRRVLASDVLAQWLGEVLRGERPAPDAVITDATTVQEWQSRGLWRQLDVSAAGDSLHVPIGRIQCTTPDGARYAIPLAVNPLGAWYSHGLLASFLPDASPDAVSAAFGVDSTTFRAFLTTAAAAVPDSPIMSSTLDDYILPALDQAFQQPGVLTPQWQVDMQAAAQRTEALQVSAAERHFSGNWYQGIAHEHTGLIIAGRWMQTALMRAVGEGTSGWRLTQPAGGYIAGASLVCAIPERAGQPEQAASVATDLAAEVDAQLLLCAATGTVPSLRAAHQHAPFVGTDAFCGGQAVGSIWCTAATALISAPVTAEQIELRRLARTELVAAFIP